jgi:antitoxin HicB
MLYPVRITHQDVGNYAVGFPDIPEALTLGDTEEKALRHAVDALETALDFYFDHGRPDLCLPPPSAAKSWLRFQQAFPPRFYFLTR